MTLKAYALAKQAVVIIECLHKHGRPVTMGQINNEIGVSGNAYARAMRRLVDSRAVSKRGDPNMPVYALDQKQLVGKPAEELLDAVSPSPLQRLLHDAGPLIVHHDRSNLIDKTDQIISSLKATNPDERWFAAALKVGA